MFSLSNRVKALFLALGIFVLGVVCGATVERWILLSQNRPFNFKGPPPHDSFRGGRGGGRGPAEHLMQRFTHELDLTPEQEQQIKRILDESRESIQKLRHETHAMLENQTRGVREKIRELLTPDQQKKYDQISEHFEHRMKSKPWPPRPGGPPR